MKIKKRPAILSLGYGMAVRGDRRQRRPAEKCRRGWIVHPLDGTKEFITGIPEFGSRSR